MDKVQQSSKRLVWTIIGVAVVVFVVISGILYILFGMSTAGNKPAATTNKSQSSTAQATATEQDVKNNLNQLNAAIKQASLDQQAARTAINEGKNQVKVGN